MACEIKTPLLYGVIFNEWHQFHFVCEGIMSLLKVFPQDEEGSNSALLVEEMFQTLARKLQSHDEPLLSSWFHEFFNANRDVSCEEFKKLLNSVVVAFDNVRQ